MLGGSLASRSQSAATDLTSHDHATASHADVIAIVKSGNNEKLHESLRMGADTSRRDAGGCTALIRAAERGNVRAIELLIAFDADIEAKDNFGWTALICACRFGRVDAAAALIAANADLKATDSLRATAETTARKFGKHSEYAEAVRRATDLKALRLQQAQRFEMLLAVMLARQRQLQVDDSDVVPNAALAAAVARAGSAVRRSGCAGEILRRTPKEDTDGVRSAALAAALATLPSGLLVMVGEAMMTGRPELPVKLTGGLPLPLRPCAPSIRAHSLTTRDPTRQIAIIRSNCAAFAWPRSFVARCLATLMRRTRASGLPKTKAAAAHSNAPGSM